MMNLGLRLIHLCLVLLYLGESIAQTVTTPQPCTNPPFGTGCRCGSAGILCTPDDLDNYTFTMSSTPNSGGLPSNDLCPGLPADGIPNNVNWFAFIAWCTDLTLNVSLSNCARGTQGGNTNDWGVQIALFGECSTGSTGWDPIQCLTDAGVQCGDNNASFPTSFSITGNGLTIGQTYYFMVDGCNGSTCDVTIDVVGTCGTGEIDPWTTGLTGPDTICLGNPATYTAEDIDGAVQFFYYLDGTLIANGDNLLTVTPNFLNPGTYQLCVDVANLPCVLESDDPAPFCKTIVVCPEADAGSITATPNPTCPGDDIAITISGYTPVPNAQYLIITLPNGEIVHVEEGDNTTFTYEECQQFIVYSYNLKEITQIPVLGTNFPTDYPPCDDACCDIEEIEISFADGEDPVFVSPPGNISLTCIDDLMPGMDLPYTDNCIDPGMAGYVEDDDTTPCDGGTVVRTWIVVDSCGNEAEHVQTITIDPIPIAQFQNPPMNTTVDCNNIPTSAPDLTYTNNLSGACQITGTVSPTMSGIADQCGGTITFTWEATDDCNRTITHTQTITVTPAPQPQFIDPPTNLTVDCDNIPTSAPDLAYTNNESGNCEISGTVSPTMSGSANECGGTITYTWQVSDPCGRPLTHTQTITVTPADQADFINPPASTTLECVLMVPTPPNLSYTNNLTGNCEIAGTVSPTTVTNITNCSGTVTHTWTFTDICNRVKTHTQTITIVPPALPAYLAPPSNVTVNCENIPTSAPDLLITNNGLGNCLIEDMVSPSVSGSANACGGTIINTWSYTDICDRQVQHIQTITVNPAPVPVFDTPAPDITVTCEEIPPLSEVLAYTNGASGVCSIEGSVAPTRSGTANACGGLLLDTYTFTDNCGRTISAVRRIIVEPAAQAEFIDPPADITISCADAGTAPILLAYTNNASGACMISGSVTAIVSNNYTACGGTITHFYTFTDPCGRNITHTRVITVEPASEPTFLNPPADVTVECNETYTPPITLTYDNGEVGLCRITGQALVTLGQGSGVVTNTWQFTSPCTGITYTHTQQVTKLTAPNLVLDPYDSRICLGEGYDLNNIFINDLNNTFPDITFHFASPPTPANEVPDPNVSPSETTSYYIQGINEFLCDDVEIFTLYIDEPLNAGDDQIYDFCLDGNIIDLYQYLGPTANLDGIWYDFDGNGFDMSSPNFFNFNGAPTGIYNLYYVTFPNLSCPGDTAIITFDIKSEIIYNSNIECINGGTQYEVTITGENIVVYATLGSVNQIDDTTFVVTNIPINLNVDVVIEDQNTSCQITRLFLAPNCDCPDVPAPTGIPNYKICTSEVPLTMNATAQPGLQINWFDTQTSTTPLATNIATFTHIQAIPGLYDYYVEALDPVTNCTSENRLKIVVEVVNNPVITNITSSQCDDNSDGLVSFNIDSLANLVNNNPNNTKTYHLSLEDAQSKSNAIISPYINTLANQKIYIRVSNPTGCVNIGEIILVNNPRPTFVLTFADETCLNLNDGFANLSAIQSSGPLLTNINGGLFTATTVYDSLAPGNYAIRTRDSLGCTSLDSFDINSGLQLTLSNFQVTCNNAGTLTDPLDDTYNITFSITNNKGNNGQYYVYNNGVLLDSVAYNTLHNLVIPANGSAVTLTFEDKATGCSIDRDTPPLEPCSTDCQLTLDSLSYICTDNGTDTNPADDTYTLRFNVSAVNGSNTGLYRLLVNGQIRGLYMYNSPSTLVIPASNSTVAITIQDEEDSQCRLILELEDLAPCSDGCEVDFSMVSNICNNNGTVLDVSDDIYTATFTVRGVNLGNTFTYTLDGMNQGNGMYQDTISLTIPADNASHELIIQDLDRPECSDTFITQALGPCSSTCGLQVNSTMPVCDNNNTNQTSDDDTYSFSLTINNNTGSNWTISELNRMGAYGQTINVGPIPISQGITSLNIIDSNVPECNESIAIVPPPTCSECLQTVVLSVTSQIDCQNPEVTLTAQVTPGGTFTWYYNGEIQGNTLNITTGNTGLYTFEAIYNDGCTLLDSIEVIGNASIPRADAGNNKALNCAIYKVTLGGTNTSIGSEYRYEWTDSLGNIIATTATLEVDVPGTYFLQVFFANTDDCKSAKDRVTVTYDVTLPSVAIYANPGEIFDCIISTIILSTDNEVNVRYDWITPEGLIQNTNTLTISQPGNYILIATNTTSKCIDTGRISIVSFEEYPEVNLYTDDSLNCVINTIQIIAETPTVLNPITYEWSNINDTSLLGSDSVLTIQAPGIYIVQLTDQINGCTNSDTIEINAYENEILINISTEITITQGDVITLNPQFNIPDSEIARINWSPSSGLSCSDCKNPQVNINEDATYTIMVEDIYGCVGVATVTIRARAKTLISVPNVINLSGGDNGVFVISSNDEDAIIEEITVYDRWGNLMYRGRDEGVNTPIQWDITFNQQVVAQGVYVYYAKVKLSNGELIELVGDITVIK